MSRRLAWAFVAAAGLVTVVAACKKNDQSAEFAFGTNGTNTAGYGGAAPYGTPTTTTPASTTPPPATTTPPAGGDPITTGIGLIGGIVSGLGAGTPTGDMLTNAVQYNAKDNAPGMRAEGSLIRLQMNQGQTSEAQITLQPGRCYTLVGAASPGVMDVVVKVTPPGIPQQVLGQNQNAGPMPVVWAKDQCFRNPTAIPAPVRVEVTMRQGAGAVGIQPYVK